MLAGWRTSTIGLLGGFAAAVDGEPVPERAWRLKKARELVKLLALAPGHRLHREQVMDVLWRDRDPAAAANNLHQAVHVARRALGARRSRCARSCSSLAAEIDVDRFELAAADARRAGTHAAYEPRSRCTEASCCPRTATTTGRRSAARSWRSCATALAQELAALGPAARAALACPADRARSSAAERELGELRRAAGAGRGC